MKRFFPVYLVVGLVLTLVGGISLVSAQTETVETTTPLCDNTICGSPSPELRMIVDFVSEMMNSIKTIGPQGDYLGDYVNPDWFEGNTFIPPEQNVVSTVGRNLAQKALFGVATATVFSNPTNWGGVKDVLGNTVLLRKDKVFLRDTKLIEELESQLSTKKLEIGLGGGWFTKINPTNRAVMTDIIQTYVDKGLLDAKKISFPDGVLYVDVVSLLTQMLSSAKSFLYLDTTYQFTEVSRGGDNGIRIGFVAGLGEKMQAAYSCAKGSGNVCDENKQNFGDLWGDLKSIVSGGINDGFVDVIKDASDRFVETFSKEEDSDQFETRKNDLLQSTYGRTERKGNFLGGRLGFTTNATGELKEVGNSLVDAWKYATNKDFRSVVADQTKATEDASLDDVAIVSNYDKAEVVFENILRGYVSDVFEQQALDIELASFAEVKDITPAFDVLGSQITAIKDQIVGNKTQEGSLVKALGDACELQCGRGGTCRK